MQCTTGTPAARAAAHSRAPFGITVAAADAASSGSTESAPITPFWHSLVTTAVCAGSSNASRSRAIGDSRR